MLSMSAHSTTMEPMHFGDSENPCKCHSTEAVIKHAKDDGEEEVTSKMTPMTPIPKKSIWEKIKKIKDIFRDHNAPPPFAKYPPPCCGECKIFKIICKYHL